MVGELNGEPRLMRFCKLIYVEAKTDHQLSCPLLLGRGGGKTFQKRHNAFHTALLFSVWRSTPLPLLGAVFAPLQSPPTKTCPIPAMSGLLSLGNLAGLRTCRIEPTGKELDSLEGLQHSTKGLVIHPHMNTIFQSGRLILTCTHTMPLRPTPFAPKVLLWEGRGRLLSLIQHPSSMNPARLAPWGR